MAKHNKETWLESRIRLCDVHFDNADVEKEKFLFDTYISRIGN